MYCYEESFEKGKQVDNGDEDADKQAQVNIMGEANQNASNLDEDHNFFFCSLNFCVNLTAATNKHKWCVAKPSASDVELINNIDYVCRTLKDTISCMQIIGPGGSCF
ncbi:hypothetical protein QQ045_019979 [Rhodiola kirilowii]